jgi:hypothetical protein
MTRTLSKLCLAALLAAAIPAGGRASPPVYKFTTIDVPGATDTQLLGINYSDQIVGYSNAAANGGFQLNLPNSFVPVNYPGSTMTQVYGIGGAGRLSGSYVDPSGVTHGFFRSIQGVYSTADAPGAAFTQIRGFNLSGQVAGYSSTDPTGMTNDQAFILNPNHTFDYLGSLLPAGTVSSVATRINNNGIITGYYVDSSGSTHGFVGTSTQLSTFDVPGATLTQVLNTSNVGQRVGDFIDANGVTHGFVYGNPFFNGGGFLTIDDPPGVSTTVTGIDDNLNLIGTYVDASGVTHGFIALFSIAEPTGLTLAGVALGGMALRTWRKRRAA